MKLYRCVVEIKINAEFEDGFGLSKGPECSGDGGSLPPPHFTPMAHIHFKSQIIVS